MIGKHIQKKIIKRHVISVVQWFDMVNVSR